MVVNGSQGCGGDGIEVEQGFRFGFGWRPMVVILVLGVVFMWWYWSAVGLKEANGGVCVVVLVRSGFEGD